MRNLTLALAAALAAAFAAPATAQIFLPGTQPGEVTNWPLWEPSLCRICHGQYVIEDYEPWETWAGSMMANSARDPLFWAAVDIANQDSPGAGELCIRCHAPRAWLEGRSSAADGSAMLGSPGRAGQDFEGVECHVCHRMYEGPDGTPFLQNAQFWIDDGTPTVPPLMRGPYAETQAPHGGQYSEYHHGSELCAVCHNVKNPLVNLVDENGLDTGLPFPEQTTYDEWAQSRFPEDGIECQTCHMPAVSGYACTDLFPLRDELPKHELSGANAWMSQVLNGEYGASLRRTEHFDRAYNLALENLQQNSADLDVTVPSRLTAGHDAQVRVRVTNRTGHKLPTGYPEGRRMWIHLLVEDASGTTLFESGAYDPASATLALGGTKVYEARHGVQGEGAGFHLVRNDRIVSDNRIPPAGFRPDASTRPADYEYPVLDDGTLPNWDVTRYRVPIPPDARNPVAVTAALYYQTASRGYVEFLRDENVSGPDPHDPDPNAPSRGEKIWSVYEKYGRSAPILMEARTRKIDLDLAPPRDGPAPPPRFPRITSTGRNPFRDRTTVTFEVPAACSARLAVFDVGGRMVRSLAEVPGAGRHTVTWDGRDDTGAAAVSGSYFLRLDVDGASPVVRRILLLR